MSISLQNTPDPFQPVLSDGNFFTVESSVYDPDTTFKFRYVYELYVEGQNVFNGKCTPNPYGLGIIDMQQVLETYTDSLPISYWDTTAIYTHQTFPFSRPANNEVINYYLKIGYEYAASELGAITGFTGIGESVGDPNFETDVYKVFRSTMGTNGRATQQSFDIDPYVLSGTPTTINPTTSGLFLTNSPRIRRIAETDYYTLGFTNYFLTESTTSYDSEPYYAEFTFYDSNNSPIAITQWDNLVMNGGGPRSLCTQVYPSLYLNYPASGTTDYNTLYLGVGPMNIPDFPDGTARYTVQLFGKFTGSTSPIPATPSATPFFTRTPTPSVTTTPSSTPICSTCTNFDVQYTGDSESVATVTIINCLNGQSQTFQAQYNVVYNVCSCGIPFDTGQVKYTNNGSCNPNPTQTPTPTVTRTPSPTPSVTATKTPTPTPTPTTSVVVYSYLGRTTPDSTDGPDACTDYLTARGYKSTKTLSTLTNGDYLYDVYPSAPTVGGGNWIALKVGGVGQGYAFQVQDDGEITDTYTC
jgi:hypothetical protein